MELCAGVLAVTARTFGTGMTDAVMAVIALAVMAAGIIGLIVLARTGGGHHRPH